MDPEVKMKANQPGELKQSFWFKCKVGLYMFTFTCALPVECEYLSCNSKDQALQAEKSANLWLETC